MKRYVKKFKKLNWFKWLLSVFSATDDIPYTAEEFVQAARGSENFKVIRNILWFFWGYLLTLVVLSAYILNNQDTLFNVTAITETVEIKSYPGTQFPDWSLTNSIIIDDLTDRTIPFSGTLSINSNSQITVERIGKGRAYISIESEDTSAAKIQNEDDSIEELSNSIIIQLGNTSEPIVLPIDGVITIGQNIKEGLSPSPILITGDVTISDKAFISREYYLTEPKHLKIGDVFEIHKSTTQSSGFIRIYEEEGFSISYNGKGKSGVISRYKSVPIYIQNNIWSKLSNDNTLIFFWIFLIVFYTGAKIIIRLNLDSKKSKY